MAELSCRGDIVLLKLVFKINFQIHINLLIININTLCR